MQWPFLWTQKQFNTTVNTGLYSYDASVAGVDWDTFNIVRQPITITSLTSSGLVATVTVSGGHQCIVGDAVIINNAAQSAYNGTFNITYVSATQFTYTMTTTAASPATGTPVLIPPYSNYYLALKDYDEYLRNWRDVDIQAVEQDNTNSANLATSAPRFIVRKPDNNFIISPYPNRIYTVGYDAFIVPTDLSASTDVPLLPALFKQVIIDRINVYMLAFRDNDAQLVRNDKRFEENCNRMRRILIPQTEAIMWKP